MTAWGLLLAIALLGFLVFCQGVMLALDAFAAWDER